MRGCVMIAAAAILASVSSASAQQRCIGPKDNTVAPTYGVAAINPADITWCDDFDSYCNANCGDCAAGEPTSIWPGYPPTPDNLCAVATDHSEVFFRKPYHWPQPALSNPAGLSSAAAGNWPSRWEGWDGNPGWTTEPYTVLYQGGTNTAQYHTFSLAAAANHKFPGADSLNGTDEHPLTLRFWLNPAEGKDPVTGRYNESPPNLPLYVELRKDDDHAPTDYVEKNCSPEVQGPYPAVCQQRHLPTGCPPLSTAVHASLAFGWLAQLDRNPCDVETGRKPTTYHAGVFDGNRWTQLFNSMFPGQVNGFNWDSAQAYFEMKVKSSTAEIKLMAYKLRQRCGDDDCSYLVYYYELVTSTATVPRQYLGPFNRISFGAAPGCKLDATGACVGEPDIWRYADGHYDWGWTKNHMDRLTLLGGVGESTLGACCQADRSCVIVNGLECTSAGGVFLGSQTACEPDTCVDVICPTPFADGDFDGDVDMADFAGLQRCLTSATPVARGCGCFDQNQDGAIDSVEIEKFVLCATGAEATWSPTPACP